MDVRNRYGMIVTAEDAVFFLLKRTLINVPQHINVERASISTPAGTAAFILSGSRMVVPMSAAVRIALDAQNNETGVARAIHAAAMRRISDVEAEYRATLHEINVALALDGNSEEMIRGLQVLRGSITTRLTITTFSIAA